MMCIRGKKLHSLALALRSRANIFKLWVGCVQLLISMKMAQFLSLSFFLSSLISEYSVEANCYFSFRHQMQI